MLSKASCLATLMSADDSQRATSAHRQPAAVSAAAASKGGLTTRRMCLKSRNFRPAIAAKQHGAGHEHQQPGHRRRRSVRLVGPIQFCLVDFDQLVDGRQQPRLHDVVGLLMFGIEELGVMLIVQDSRAAGIFFIARQFAQITVRTAPTSPG